MTDSEVTAPPEDVFKPEYPTGETHPTVRGNAAATLRVRGALAGTYGRPYRPVMSGIGDSGGRRSDPNHFGHTFMWSAV